jgi:hypothetical protein
MNIFKKKKENYKPNYFTIGSGIESIFSIPFEFTISSSIEIKSGVI